MSSEEIVKLLRRCMFSDTLLQIAADKIEELESETNRQKAEIERLKSNLKFVRGTVKRALSENERLQKESKEQFKNWEILDERTKQRYAELYEEAKEVVRAEAIKEFAERLKDKVDIDLCEAIDCSDYLYSLPKLIDNLVKEMENET